MCVTEFREMELLPWKRFWVAVNVLSEQRAVQENPFCESTDPITVFLMTDDHNVAREAQADLKERMLFVNHSIIGKLPHEGGTSTNNALWENFLMSMLNLHACVKCTAFISQRQANFARLIDELRMTRFEKFGEPYVEFGRLRF
jgi:hypothetical protein